MADPLDPNARSKTGEWTEKKPILHLAGTPKPEPAKPAEPAAERMVSVKLLHSVWVADATAVGGARKILTNIPVKDEEGNIMVDKKSKSIITTQTIADLPLSLAKQMIDEGKAVRMDPL